MTLIIEKSKSDTRQIIEMAIDDILNFSVDRESSIRSLISGNNRGGIKKNYSRRIYTVNKTQITVPGTSEKKVVVQVKRTK